jgi:hypothetical protein
MGFFRRSGSEVGRVIASAADPAAEVGRSLFYSKTVAGLVQLFTRASGGVISQLTPLAAKFNDSVAGAYNNIQGNRTSQSAIDNTKTGITNFGSSPGLGATADYATIVGGSGCVASDFAAIAGGDGAKATGFGAVALGEGPTASGDQSVAMGNGPTASGDNAAAFGVLTVASGNSAFAMGDGTNVAGDFAAGFGNGTSAAGEAAFVAGQGGDANGQASVCMGDGGIADGYASASLNTGNAGGDYSTALNVAKTDPAAEGCFAHGVRGFATRFGQHSFGSGAFTAGSAGYGEVQTSELVLRGSTPGAAVGESTELKFGGYSGSGSTQFILEDSKTYSFDVTVAAGGVQAGPTRVSRIIKFSFNARRAAGVTVITGAGSIAATSDGDAATATWTVVATVGAAPDRIVLTFATGVGAASACKVAARVEFTEVKF